MRPSNNASARWSCRRGMLELDLLLTPFHDACWQKMNPQEQNNFTQLLMHSDIELYEWIMGTSLPSKKKFIPLLNAIKRYAKTGS